MQHADVNETVALLSQSLRTVVTISAEITGANDAIFVLVNRSSVWQVVNAINGAVVSDISPTVLWGKLKKQAPESGRDLEKVRQFLVRQGVIPETATLSCDALKDGSASLSARLDALVAEAKARIGRQAGDDTEALIEAMGDAIRYQGDLIATYREIIARLTEAGDSSREAMASLIEAMASNNVSMGESLLHDDADTVEAQR